MTDQAPKYGVSHRGRIFYGDSTYSAEADDWVRLSDYKRSESKLAEALKANIELAALLRERPQEATVTFGWAIEGAWSPVDRPEYWVGSSSWSTDPYKALRFATRESAQQAADLMCAGMNVRIACHEWAGNSHHE